ncbi:MAG: hypothetical protein WBB96_10540 [Candidatus Dechloromonas phosphoritropha]
MKTTTLDITRSSTAMARCAALGSAPATVLLDLGQIFPGDVRPDREHVPRQRRLDRYPVLRRVVVVQPADPAIGGQPGIRRDSGAGDEQHPARRGKTAGDAIDHGQLVHSA